VSSWAGDSESARPGRDRRAVADDRGAACGLHLDAARERIGAGGSDEVLPRSSQNTARVTVARPAITWRKPLAANDRQTPLESVSTASSTVGWARRISSSSSSRRQSLFSSTNVIQPVNAPSEQTASGLSGLSDGHIATGACRFSASVRADSTAPR
jgi:hypothetical protein